MLENKLTSIINNHIKNDGFSNISVAIQSIDKSINFIGANGIANPKTMEKMEQDTPYFIASVTKMYTSTIIMQLLEEKRLDIGAPISKYLQESIVKNLHIFKGADYSDQITLSQLVNQSTGLADFETEKPKGDKSVLDKLVSGNDLFIDLNEALKITRNLPPHFPPGTPGKAHYSNINYRLLGEIIQNVTLESLEYNFNERICKPLGLNKTYLYNYLTPQQGKTPATIYLNKKPANVPKYLSSNRADGGLVSNASECITFLRAFFEGRLFNKNYFNIMMKWNKIFFPMQYGYGLMYFKLPRYFWFTSLPEFIGHSGSTGSFAFLCPSRSLYLAGTINQVSPIKPFFFNDAAGSYN